MQHSRFDAVPPRYGEWGPAYLIEGPTSDIGLLTMRPGDAMTNHIHHHCDESFVVIEGSITLWVGAADRYALTVGDVYRCAPREMHYFVNEGADLARVVFVKSPASPGDTINLPWVPGEPAPAVPSAPEPPDAA